MSNNYFYQLKKIIIDFKKDNPKNKFSDKFIKFISKEKVSRTTNSFDHFGIFFLPVNFQEQKLFLIHHKKADCYIPPGGHMEDEESPIQTVKREFNEELGNKIVNEKIVLFDISITDVSKNPRSYPCKTHYDLWYYVKSPILNFKIDKNEFYKGRWFNIKDANMIISRVDYKLIINGLFKAL